MSKYYILIVLAMLGISNINANETVVDQPKKTKTYQVDAFVSVLDEIQLPARRNGVLKTMAFRKGDLISQGQVVAVIDKADAESNLAVRQAELAAAASRAKDNSQIVAAQTGVKIATVEFETLMRVRRSAVDLEIARVQGELDTQKATLQNAVAEHEHAGLDSQVAKAKLDVASLDIVQRTAKSPLTGIVSKVHNQQGEWVKEGDPIASIVRLDVLLIESYVDIGKLSPRKCIGADVKFVLANEDFEFDGKIKNASPTVDADGKYQVWCEVKNRKEAGVDGKQHWILRPGMAGNMNIKVVSQ